MSGNVWEWCSDWYAGTYPSSNNNPTGAETGSFRVLRGGGWYYDADSARVSYRYDYNPDSRNNSVGFRLVSSSE